jgi:hypothetical protein
MRSIKWRTLSLAAWAASGEKYQYGLQKAVVILTVCLAFEIPLQRG